MTAAIRELFLPYDAALRSSAAEIWASYDEGKVSRLKGIVLWGILAA